MGIRDIYSMLFCVDWRKYQPVTIKEFIRRRKCQKAVLKWNADNDTIQRKIDRSTVREKEFKWCHLVWQEISMWISIGKQVTAEEFVWMCDRRGFDTDMSLYLIEMMRYVGLGKELNNELIPEVNNERYQD